MACFPPFRYLCDVQEISSCLAFTRPQDMFITASTALLTSVCFKAPNLCKCGQTTTMGPSSAVVHKSSSVRFNIVLISCRALNWFGLEPLLMFTLTIELSCSVGHATTTTRPMLARVLRCSSCLCHYHWISLWDCWDSFLLQMLHYPSTFFDGVLVWSLLPLPLPLPFPFFAPIFLALSPTSGQGVHPVHIHRV